MSTALQILQKIKSINVLQAAQESIEQTADDMVFIQKNQLFHGVRPDGRDVFPDYTPLTKFIKAQKGQPFDRVTRRDTGAYYRGIGVIIQGDKYEIQSTDDKAEMLDLKYGEIGLSQESKASYIEILKPVFIEKITSRLQ